MSDFRIDSRLGDFAQVRRQLDLAGLGGQADRQPDRFFDPAVETASLWPCYHAFDSTWPCIHSTATTGVALRQNVLSLLTYLLVLSLPSLSGAEPSRLLKGIEIIVYDANAIESAKPDGRCKLDRERLQTTLQFTANQSTRLKFVTRKIQSQHATELYQAASAKFGSDAEKAAMKAAVDYNFMPTFLISGTIMEPAGACAISLNATLDARINLETAPLIPSGVMVTYPITQIWKKGYWLTAPPDKFSDEVDRIVEHMMKELVNDWAESQ